MAADLPKAYSIVDLQKAKSDLHHVDPQTHAFHLTTTATLHNHDNTIYTETHKKIKEKSTQNPQALSK